MNANPPQSKTQTNDAPAEPSIRGVSSSPFRTGDAEFDAGVFGMKLFLVSLAMLFGASLLGFVVIRIQLRDVWPDDLPPLPRLLWVGTGLLLISSGTIQRAAGAARSSKATGGRAVAIWMSVTLALGIGFIFVQALSWREVLGAMEAAWYGSDRYRFALASFYVLSGVHALHVIGGILPMAVVTRRAFLGRSDTHRSPAGVVYCAMYWHFLDAVWVVLFATLLLGL